MQITSSYRGASRVFERETTPTLIGRKSDGVQIDLDLTPDLSVSSPHARLWQEGERYWIEDLDSIGGTRVNDQEIRGKGRYELRAGDVITIGETELRIQDSGTEPFGKVEASTIPPEIASLDATDSAANAAEIANMETGRPLTLSYDSPRQ